MRIAIDAGHGLYTPGKRCLKAIDPKETREWVLNSRIANYLQEYLKRYDCEVKRVDDVTGAKDIALSERCRAANNWKADFYLSIHHNAGINGGSGGGAVVYSYRGTSAETHQKRDIIYDEFIKTTGLRGNRYDGTLTSGFYVLVSTNMPAVLIECGFMDSTVDTPIILTDAFAKKAADGLLNGLVKSLGLKKIEVAPAQPEEPGKVEEEEIMTQEKFNQMMNVWLSEKAEKEPSAWSEEARRWAEENGIIVGTGAGMSYLAACTREQMVEFLYRMYKLGR